MTPTKIIAAARAEMEKDWILARVAVFDKEVVGAALEAFDHLVRMREDPQPNYARLYFANVAVDRFIRLLSTRLAPEEDRP